MLTSLISLLALPVTVTPPAADTPVEHSTYAAPTNTSLFERIDIVSQLKPSLIPLQIPQSNTLFSSYRERAAKNIVTHAGQCAKFVNRLFMYRFNKQVFGNAWDLQQHSAHQDWLQLAWQIPEDSFQRQGLLRLVDRIDRIKHIKSLYDFLDAQDNPSGTLGSVYRFSSYRAYVAADTKFLPQTHISFISHKQQFSFQNKTDVPQTLQQVITDQYGPMRDFEVEYFNTKLALQKSLQPKEKYFFDDYLVEEEIFGIQAESLLQVMLRKEIRNDIDYPQLRPVSFSLLSQQIQDEIVYQETLLDLLGPVDFIAGDQWENVNFEYKDQWKKMLASTFGISDPIKATAIPVPR